MALITHHKLSHNDLNLLIHYFFMNTNLMSEKKNESQSNNIELIYSFKSDRTIVIQSQSSSLVFFS